MSDSTISQLPAASPLTGGELFPVDQGGVTKKATLNMIGFGTGNIIIAGGKTFTVNAALTLNGTDGTSILFPTTNSVMARTDAAQSFTGLQTFTNGITTPAQITSTIVTGTAPFVVASTTPVANLSIGGNAATATNVSGGHVTTATDTGIGVLGSSTTNSGVKGTSTSGLGVEGVSNTNYGVSGVSTTNYGIFASGDKGIYALGVNGGIYGTSTNAYGVYGITVNGTGVNGTSTNGAGVSGASTNSYGVIASGTTASPAISAFRIVPQNAIPTGPNQVSDIYTDLAGALHVCTVAGSPGTWSSYAISSAAQSFTGLQTFTNGITTPAQITSTIVTGTAPFVVASTTPVANLAIGGNAGTATKLAAPVTIDGVSFDGSANVTVVAPATHAATNKVTPVAADEFPIWDSVSTLLNKVTYANLISAIGGAYAPTAGNASQVFSAAAATAPANVVRLDQMPQYPFRNRVINGDLAVWQIATTQNLTTSFAYGSADMFTGACVNNSQATISKTTSTVPGLPYALKLQRTNGVATTGAQYVNQAMEVLNIQPLQGQTIAFSYWAKAGANYSSAASALSVLVVSGTGADATNLTATFGGWTGSVNALNTTDTLTTSWQRFTHVFTLGATVTQAGFMFSYTPVGTAGADDSVSITGIQFEPVVTGSTVGTSYEVLPYETQLRRCQRYLPYYGKGNYAVAPAMFQTTTNAIAVIQFPVPLRVPPTSIVVSAMADFNVNGTAPFVPSAFALSVPSTMQTLITCTVAAATAGQGGFLFINSANGYIYFTGAQL